MKMNNYAHILGSCLTMCPRKEVILRQRENLVNLLECRINSKGERTRFGDQQKMVKEYSRPAAGQVIESDSIRPLLVLQRTVHYLLSSICSASDVSWREIYEFVENRLRAVRQDITVQGLTGIEVVKVLSPIARFYTYAHYRFCEYEDSNFDPYLNLTQLHETLLTILTIYEDDLYIFESPIIDLERKLKEKSGIENESFSEDEDGDISMVSVNKKYPPVSSLLESLKLSDSKESTLHDTSSRNDHNIGIEKLDIETPCSSESGLHSRSNNLNGKVHNDFKEIDLTRNPESSKDSNFFLLTNEISRTIIEKDNCVGDVNLKKDSYRDSESMQNFGKVIVETVSDKQNINWAIENVPETGIYNSDNSHSYTNIRNMDACLFKTKPSDESDQKRTISCTSILRYTVMEEMVTLYLLVHLGNSEALSHALKLPRHLRNSDLVSRAFETSKSWMLDNHFPLMRLSLRLPPILLCALHLHLNKIQRRALGVLSVSHNSKGLTFHIKDLEKQLLFSSSESLLKTCSYYGLSASTKGVQFLKTNFKWDAAVINPEKANWIESKLKEFTTAELLLP